MSTAGVQHFTFHIEATSDPVACIRKIKEAGMKVFMVSFLSSFILSSLPQVGLALKPKTALDSVLTLLEHSDDPLRTVDMVLVMTVSR